MDLLTAHDLTHRSFRSSAGPGRPGHESGWLDGFSGLLGSVEGR